ncbi:MAG TPA: nitroreductase [Lachnospiraceae bacterium]|nr:nitroreductase [Lachnospiraceae bacterium]
MDFKEAMRQRHMVRRYTDRPLPAETVKDLEGYIDRMNHSYGLSVELKTEDSSAFNAVIKLVLAKEVRNFFIMAGKDAPDLDERLGYCGAGLMLYAQTLGLNTWWVGGTFSRKRMAEISHGNRVAGVVAVGYGQTQGVPHKTKKPAQVGSYSGEEPEWFRRGIDAALLAPTALAKQAFMIKGSGKNVSIQCENGIFSGVDTGLVKYHFELGAGTENFEWV